MADLISGTGTDRAARRTGSRVAGAAALVLFALALLGAAVRAPDEPAVAGRASLSAMRAAFIAVMPDRVAVAVRPPAPAGNRQWLAAASSDRGGGALPGQAPAALAFADATLADRPAGHAARTRQEMPARPSASPFAARAPPARA